MLKQYHRPPFNEANLLMSAETTKAAKTTADTTKTAGSPKAGAHAADAANNLRFRPSSFGSALELH